MFCQCFILVLVLVEILIQILILQDSGLVGNFYFKSKQDTELTRLNYDKQF